MLQSQSFMIGFFLLGCFLFKVNSYQLSEKVGITVSNLSILKTGKAKAVRFSTLELICEVLDCQPGDLLEHKGKQ